MPDIVYVDGVTLTRAQVERALKELNTPTFQTGDIVQHMKNGFIGIVVLRGTPVAGAIERAWPGVVGGREMHIIGTGGGAAIGAAYSWTPESLVLVQRAGALKG